MTATATAAAATVIEKIERGGSGLINDPSGLKLQFRFPVVLPCVELMCMPYCSCFSNSTI